MCKNRQITIISAAVVIMGVVLLILNIILGDRFNTAYPLIFFTLGGGFLILIFQIRDSFAWASWLYIPSFILICLGVILLLNMITQDSRSWAYAWLLIIAAIGVGGIFADKSNSLPKIYKVISWVLAISGITFFGVFGVIAGGPFIQIFAPILLVTAGFGLRFLKTNPDLADSSSGDTVKEIRSNQSSGGNNPVDLSSREVDVLRLINKGLSNQQIALRLSIAESTVKTHINNIYAKLEVQSRVQAINKGHQLHLLDD